MKTGFGLDAEADNLYLESSEMWTIKFKSFCGTKMLRVQPFKEGKELSRKRILKYINSFPKGSIVTGHNHLGYDMWMFWKHLDIPFVKGYKGKDYFGTKEVIFIDTLPLSQFLAPDRYGGHSLDNLASSYGTHKMKFRQELIELDWMKSTDPKGYEFARYHPLMEEYVDQDVEALLKIFNGFSRQMFKMYGHDWWDLPCVRDHQKDHYLYAAQCFGGVKFDRGAGIKLSEHIGKEMDLIDEVVLPKLPKRPLKKTEESYYRVPAKPFKNNGDLSATMNKWIVKHEADIIYDDDGVAMQFFAYGKLYPIESKLLMDIKLPMLLKDNDAIKDWFMREGWEPTFWNYKKGKDGKPLRDPITKELIKTSPKIQDKGNICPNLLELEGELPSKIVKYLSYKNRKGILDGWLADPRLDYDGRLSAGISGYTPTFRVKHVKVTNVPKASDKVLLGKEFRALFITEEGNDFIGADASALENRTIGHYTTEFDGGAFANLMLEGDPHTASAFAFFPWLHDEFDCNDPSIKEDPKFSLWRDLAKTGNYLLAYGGGAGGLSNSLNLSKSDGAKAYDNYWDANPGLKAFKEYLEDYWAKKGGKKRIVGIDGRFLSVRSKMVLVNVAGQGCGAIVMSKASLLMDEKLGGLLQLDEYHRPYYIKDGMRAQRTLMVHDEYSFESNPGLSEYIREESEKSIVEAGVIFNLKIPLAAEGKVGKSWYDVH